MQSEYDGFRPSAPRLAAAFGMGAIILAVLFGLTACSALPPVDYATQADRIGVTTSYRVQVLCLDSGDESYGSAISISAHELVTAKHVIEGCPDYLTTVYDTNGTAHLARVMKQGTDDDIALLRVEEELKSYVRLAQVKPSVGEVLCWHGGDAYLTSNGAKKCGFYWESSGELDWLSGKGAPGNSGAGILNRDGELVGILVKGSWNPSLDPIIGYVTVDKIQVLL